MTSADAPKSGSEVPSRAAAAVTATAETSEGAQAVPASCAGATSGNAAPAPTTPAPAPATAAQPQAAGPAAAVVPGGEPIAYDDHGRPTIVRHVDPETQRVRTIVQNEGGTLRAFGENTVTSLVTSAEDDARRWVEDLSDRELRGLVHEVGQRLLLSSQVYQKRQAQLEEMADSANYAYFGLSSDATEKDLDNAYRQLAKKMHPDKNGGTDEAKQRFQCMKERYEKLKARRSTPSGSETCEKDDEDGEMTGRSRDQQRREAYDEDEEDEEVRRERERDRERDRKIEYDPTDRQSLDETVWRMLKQFKTLQQGLEDIGKQLRKAAA